MSDRTADSTGKSEPRVEAEALKLRLGGHNSRRRSHWGGDECARHERLGMEKEQILLIWKNESVRV